MFTYNIQLAGYPYEKFDEKGETNFKDFIQIFNSFPWLDQLDNYDKIKDCCSATISVKAIGDEHMHARVGQVIYLGEKMMEYGVPIVKPLAAHGVFR